MTERITEVSRGYQNDIRSINRDLMEKALHMRCLAYLSQAKAGLLTQTLFEMDRSKKALHGTYCQLSEEQAVIRRQKAELEAANRELRSFSYAVSHDLRAPLRAINGFAHALGEDKAAQLDDEARDYLARIVAAAERMGVLIDGMLDLGRLSQKEMQRDEIDLSALAEAILRELETGEPGRAVRWTVAPGLRARADRNLAYSLLQNLLGNAWKYTRRRADAEIAFGAADGEAGPEFFVRDNGAGLDLTLAPRLFVPFQRYHAAREFDGLGIGLATVKRILDRHGGRIRVESAPGQGATFHFAFGE
ncbi:MAG: PAS domain-containing sensor histidine kinase [Rhodocyclaceae bacterium]|nr:PAS domain-containing sensor histidine kinase [Rhodocyclaceae bacterium]